MSRNFSGLHLPHTICTCLFWALLKYAHFATNRLETSIFKSDSTSKSPLVYNNFANYMRIIVTVLDYSSCDVMVVKSELDRSLPDHVGS